MYNETAQELLADLGISAEHRFPALETLSQSSTKYLRDLKVNVKTALASEALGEKDALLIAYATAINNKNHPLQDALKAKALAANATPDELAESAAIASLLSANNVLYRFRHFSDNKKYTELPARIRMNIMMSPVLGKECFELISLAVSAVNGCKVCVNSHEHSVRELGTNEERIFDAIRLAAIVASLDRIIG
ncbi:carboxymuconolactone decarboxylase family protein [uncultured Acetobacteroides sp.]|uniref:carboxymuconolactone decarboxylase family protein n=1 Tax=uncultured Acetobacteroides sp. TaxID=1760811 RepID=UPI0029F5501B|nr:carboxymuconolactone decarboxylase family protein [uncultured Acetobacteroides sp.]